MVSHGQFNPVIILHWDIHQHCPVFLERGFFLWLIENVAPHFLGGAVMDVQLTLVHFILHKILLSLDGFCMR